jgi:hypothetical protein
MERIPRRKKIAKTIQEVHAFLLKPIKRAHKTERIKRERISP